MRTIVFAGFATTAFLGGEALAEPGPRFNVEASLGHVELGNRHGKGLNVGSLSAGISGDNGLAAQLNWSGVWVNERQGQYFAATLGYQSQNRLWIRAEGGFGILFYKNIHVLRGITQSGELRRPADHVKGIAFNGALGLDLWRRPKWSLYSGFELDTLMAIDLAVASTSFVIGARWN